MIVAALICTTIKTEKETVNFVISNVRHVLTNRSVSIVMEIIEKQYQVVYVYLDITYQCLSFQEIVNNVILIVFNVKILKTTVLCATLLKIELMILF